MKTNFYLIVVGVALLLAALLVELHYYNRTEVDTVKPKSALTTAAADNFKAVTESQFIDHAGIPHAEYRADQNNFTAADVATNKVPDGADTIAKALNILQKQVIYWQQVATQTQATNLKAIRSNDSLKRKILYYQDAFVKIIFRPGKDSTDAGTFNYTNNDVLNITKYWKRRWLLGAKEPFIDISSNNPNTTIQGLKTLTIAQQPQNFALKGQVVGVYDIALGSVTPSVGVQVSLGKLDVSGRYYYNQHYQKFEPVLSAAYNFITIR